MVTKEELEKQYSSMSNDTLLEIIDNKHEYTNLAVSVALNEISKRNIDENQIAKYKKKQIVDFETIVVKNFVDDLKTYQKLLFYLFWFPILTFAFKNNYYREGYILKLKQASFYSWCGFGAFALTSFLIVILNLTNLASSIFIILLFPGVLYYDHSVRQEKIRAQLTVLFADNNDTHNSDQESIEL